MYKLIFQNEHFIIVDKSANVLSVPSRMGSIDARACLGKQLEIDFKTQIFPVHRLDYEVSGLVLFALNAPSQAVANKWFEQKTIRKTYEAISSKMDNAQNIIGNDQIMHWECWMMKGKKRAYEAPFGKKAITEAKFINKIVDQNKNEFYLFHLWPITGRSHQLRYELFRHGHPIIGDTLYGSIQKFELGIALRAFEINFSNCIEANEFGLPEKIKINGLTLAV